MKTLGRILVILVAFAIVMGVTYMVVNATSSSASANMPAFERGDGSFLPPDGERPEFGGKGFSPLNEERLEFGERPDFDGRGPGGGGWVFGLVRNIGIVAIIVVLIAVPRSLVRRKTAARRVE